MFQNLKIELTPSLQISAMIWLVFSACVALISIIDIAFAYQLLLAAIGFTVSISTYRQHATLCSPASIKYLHIETNELRIQLKGSHNQQAHSVHILPGSFLSTWFSFLHLKSQQSKQTYLLILSRDNCDKSAYRRLRIRLRFPTKQLKSFQ